MKEFFRSKERHLITGQQQKNETETQAAKVTIMKITNAAKKTIRRETHQFRTHSARYSIHQKLENAQVSQEPPIGTVLIKDFCVKGLLI